MSRGLVSTTCLLIAMACMTVPGEARVGETEEECVRRYGEVVERRPGGLPASDELRSVFRAASFQIVVEFRDGRAWRIDYRKNRVDAVDIEQVLEWNMAGQAWGEPFELFRDRYWLRTDRGVLARTMQGEGGEVVVVMDHAYLDANAADRRRRIQGIAGPELPQPGGGEGLLP